MIIPHIIHDTNYVLNFPEVTMGRKKRLMSELAGQGIADYKLFPAINEGVAFKNINRAHKQIIEYAKENKLPEVLVFEDDIQFTHPNSFNFYLKNKPEDFSIYLGGIYLGIIRNGIVKEFTGMHCYIVHEKFYDTFLEADEDKHIDAALSGLGKYVVCDPFIAIQYNGWSFNSQQNCNYDVILHSRKLYAGV